VKNHEPDLPGGWVANVAGAAASESTPSATPPDQSVTVTVVDPAVAGTSGAGSQYYRLNVSR
jgi:hypothetical protein